MDEKLRPLLVYQERELRVLDLEDQLKRLPLEIQAAEGHIAAEQDRLEQKRKAVQELEVRRNDLDTQLGGIEAQIIKYKNQQLAVKKQEELEALNHEIEQAQARVSDLEEAEIGLLIEIDEANAALETSRQEAEKLMALHRREIEQLKERQTELSSQVGEARSTMQSASEPVDGRYMQAYQRVRQRRPKGPVVVPVENQQCGGCHLRVAGETDAAVRAPKGPVHCENCSRMLYFE